MPPIRHDTKRHPRIRRAPAHTIHVLATQFRNVARYNSELPYELEDDVAPDVRTTHAGLPVVSGTKYAANKWIHAKKYRDLAS